MAKASYEEIGRRLREARVRAGLTQEYVANHLGVQRPVISDMETGKRKINALEIMQLAELYGCSPMSFFPSETHGEQQEEPFVCRALFRAKELTPEDRARLSWLEGFLKDFESLRKIMEGEGLA